MTDLAHLANTEAERAVLGGLLLGGPSVLLSIRDTLADALAFTTAQHRAIYAAFLELAERDTPWDYVTIVEALRRANAVEVSGGLDYIADLSDAIPSAANIAYHAAIVADLAARRQLAAQGQSAITAALDLAQPLAESIPAVVERMTRVTEARSTKPITPAGEVNAILRQIEQQAMHGDPVIGAPSGFRDLDLLTDGWVNGRLIIVAARPKMGKTGFALHIAEQAVDSDYPVLFFTAEQPRRELMKRRLAMAAGANLRAITSTHALEMQQRALTKAAERVTQGQFTIEEEPRTPGAVRLALQRYIATHGKPGLVVIDYLGKYHSDTKAERHDLAIGAMTDAFAQMAMRFDVPVVLLSQLNRDSVKGGVVRRPTISDLRDSGNIEQDAAQILFLFRDPQLPPEDLTTEISVAINRFGPTGVVHADFQKETGRWRQQHMRVA